ncbi:MAG TPA: hypothetical protein VFC19_05815 [Candidatus Limnocylindrales bacterium]|nr:hypothetical protein [Candidatus Limnocylindrales bacterium]
MPESRYHRPSLLVAAAVALPAGLLQARPATKCAVPATSGRPDEPPADGLTYKEPTAMVLRRVTGPGGPGVLRTVTRQGLCRPGEVPGRQSYRV